MGHDGLACWSDHVDVARALREPGYAEARRELLRRFDLECFAPGHLLHQFVDPRRFIEEFAQRIDDVHVKDRRWRLDGRRSIPGSHPNFGEAERGGLRLAPVAATSTSNP